MNEIVQLDTEQVSNGGRFKYQAETPYQVRVRIEGQAPLLLHAWNTEDVEAKAAARKNSQAKQDNPENYVVRNSAGEICVPYEYVRQSVIEAAKYYQDPRSKRKSAKDLYKAGIQSLGELASLEAKQWDYLDRRKVNIQRNAITRTRPAFTAGWTAEFEFIVILPEYIDPVQMREVFDMAGRVVGIADFRPTYGRYTITQWTLTNAR